jgi:hypothetical protein
LEKLLSLNEARENLWRIYAPVAVILLIASLAPLSLPLLASNISSIGSVQHAYSVSTSCCAGGWSSSNVMTAADLSALSPSSITELGLKAATEDGPQIMLNGKSTNP